MTSGDKSGMSGVFWRRGLPLGALAILALTTVNIFTELQDRAGVYWLYPVVEQYTSAATAIACLPIAWLAYRIAPLDSRPLWRAVVVQAGGLLAFCVLHVLGFYALRMLAFGLLGLDYDYDFTERFLYELRKDGFAYVLGVAAIWSLLRLQGQKTQPAGPAPATFDIRDGARVVRANLAEILAVGSAGNYVEFLLDDGRKLLMRASLASLEAELGPQGFVRTHRSWLVNVARVTELRPEKSGDYAVRLGEVEVPLSRRFPDALARLRSG